MPTERAAEQSWDSYCRNEIAAAEPLLRRLGLTIDEYQVHLGGERFLTGAWKVVLTGQTGDGERVIVKTSTGGDGIREIEREHRVRAALGALDLSAYGVFSPAEVVFLREGRHALSATSYIPQRQSFHDRPADEQLRLALRALGAQESIRLDAPSSSMSETLGVKGAAEYLASFAAFRDIAVACEASTPSLVATFDRATDFLERRSATVERYAGFLTHSDFAPHNFRIDGHRIYLLDHASIHFGNKHESWARLINHAMLESRELEPALVHHVRSERGVDEYESLRLMRAYKSAFFVMLYANGLGVTSGDLRALCRMRVAFWTRALDATLDDVPLPAGIIETFIRAREGLRSEAEHRRREAIQ